MRGLTFPSICTHSSTESGDFDLDNFQLFPLDPQHSHAHDPSILSHLTSKYKRFVSWFVFLFHLRKCCPPSSSLPSSFEPRPLVSTCRHVFFITEGIIKSRLPTLMSSHTNSFTAISLLTRPIIFIVFLP